MQTKTMSMVPLLGRDAWVRTALGCPSRPRFVARSRSRHGQAVAPPHQENIKSQAGAGRAPRFLALGGRLERTAGEEPAHPDDGLVDRLQRCSVAEPQITLAVRAEVRSGQAGDAGVVQQ